MIDICWKEEVPAGTQTITEGDIVAGYFYVVQQGSFEVNKADHDGRKSVEKAVEGLPQVLGPGSSFGELALLCLAPRAATVKALENSIVWIFDRGNFKSILMGVSDAKIETYTRCLEKVDLLK